jgi:hemerythrin HHE cation binding domain-containing protein
MKALQLLKADHARVKKLLGQLAGTTARAARTRRRLLERVATELEVHAQIEEEIFYPAAEDVDALGGLVRESREAHRCARDRLAALQRMDPADEAFAPKVEELRDAVVHHAVEEEERRMFPKVEAARGDDGLARLGAELRARKAQLLKARTKGKPGTRLRRPRVA